MNPVKIRSHLRRRPFIPIRIFLSDGSYYDVPHPELALITRRTLIIAFSTKGSELPEDEALCDPHHVTRIEPIPSEPVMK